LSQSSPTIVEFFVCGIMGRFGLTMRKTASFIDSTGCHYTGKVSSAINTERLSNSRNYRDYIFEVLPYPEDVLWGKEYEYFQFSTLEGSIYPEFPLNRVPYLHCSIKHKEIVEGKKECDIVITHFNDDSSIRSKSIHTLSSYLNKISISPKTIEIYISNRKVISFTRTFKKDIYKNLRDKIVGNIHNMVTKFDGKLRLFENDIEIMEIENLFFQSGVENTVLYLGFDHRVFHDNLWKDDIDKGKKVLKWKWLQNDKEYYRGEYYTESILKEKVHIAPDYGDFNKICRHIHTIKYYDHSENILYNIKGCNTIGTKLCYWEHDNSMLRCFDNSLVNVFNKFLNFEHSLFFYMICVRPNLYGEDYDKFFKGFLFKWLKNEKMIPSSQPKNSHNPPSN
jgi:hypothetical protein